MQSPCAILWGASTAPHPFEGNSTSSDFWALMNVPDSVPLERSSGVCNSYHRWAQASRFLAEAGLTAYRTGIGAVARSNGGDL